MREPVNHRKTDELWREMNWWSPPDREWLEYHYVSLRESTVTIATRIGASHTTVRKWLESHGIPLHPFSWSKGSGSHMSRVGRQILQNSEVPKVCSLCESKRFVIAHHKDGNNQNNHPENLQWVCRSCHSVIHGLVENLW